MQKIDVPVSKKEEISEEIHGHNIADPYRWLENSDSKETKNWIAEQNSYLESFLKNDSFNVFSQDLIRNFKRTNFFVPSIILGRKKYFYVERQPNEDQFVIYVKNGLDGSPIKLVDPNGMNKDNTVSMDYWSNSDSGRYLAYGLSEGGTEMATIYVKEVDTQKSLPDKIENCRHTEICWLPDDSGFFYIRNPRPGTVPKNEETMHSKVYFHKLGDNASDDELIFGKNRPKDDMIEIEISPDGNYVSIDVGQSWTQRDVYVYQVKNKKLIPLIIGIDAKFYLYFSQEKVIILTNYQADNYRVLATFIQDMFTPIEQWQELIPSEDFILENIALTKDKILASYLVNACSKVVIFDYNGNKKGEIPLPPYSSTAGICANTNEQEFFYGVTSFIVPKIIYRYDAEKDEYLEYKKTDNPINPDDYVVTQEWCKSKDGTKVPIFIFHRKGIVKNGTNPTILYGYGGFGNSETPAFPMNRIPWVSRNGVFAIANIRGGGEFGVQWHKSALKNNRQKCFDDFTAAAEHLISEKYTNNKQLGILGGSNGGLLVSAVAVQRPDLFSAVCSMVPLTDMVRFPKFGMAFRWTNEYGNPEIKEELDNIIKWSPYHNVKEGVEYSNFLFTTGIKDSRVDPLHARKMGAMLQSANKINQVFIFTEMDAGHGSGKPISKIVESQAMVLSFFAKYLGLKV